MAAKTLITGGTGLIGGWTLRHWEGTPPVVPGHKHFDMLEPGAIAHLLDEIGPETVVHLAWSANGTSGYRESDDNEKWLQASLDLARLCRGRGITLFCTGSVLDQTEDPADQYTRSKMELRSALAGEIAAGTVTWLRPHYVFDMAAGRPRVVAHALSAAAVGEPVRLTNPTAQHDFVHASDVGNAVAHAVKHKLRGVVEIGSGRNRRVSHLVEAMGVTWISSTAPTQSARTCPANIDALLATGWFPSSTEEFFSDV